MIPVRQKGFTLIELLVVISVISLLSSVVLSSLNSARVKAKDSLIKQEAREFEKLFAIEYLSSGSYLNIQTPQSHWSNSNGCSGFASSSYASKAIEICNKIVNNATPSVNNFHVGNNVDSSKYYSLMVYLNNGNLFCVGSSGSSEGSIDFNNLGCWANP